MSSFNSSNKSSNTNETTETIETIENFSKISKIPNLSQLDDESEAQITSDSIFSKNGKIILFSGIFIIFLINILLFFYFKYEINRDLKYLNLYSDIKIQKRYEGDYFFKLDENRFIKNENNSIKLNKIIGINIFKDGSFKDPFYCINKKIYVSKELNFKHNSIKILYPLNDKIYFLLLNNLLLFLFVIILLRLNKYYKMIHEKETAIIKTIKFKHQSNNLEAKIIQDIAENIHHELKTPIISLKNIIREYQFALDIIQQLAQKKGNRLIDRIFYLNKNPTSCWSCQFHDIENPACRYYSKNEINLSKKIIELNELADVALKNIFGTIKITKNLKSFKEQVGEINVYDVIYRSISIYHMVQKYKFKYQIDPKLKECYLNGLNPEVLTNILLNHIKNSLEANGTIITFKYIEYIENIENDPEKISSNKSTKPSKPLIHIQIIDNGNGIPKDKQRKIYQLEFSTKSVTKLRGVGLYISRELLRYYGGDEKLKFSSHLGTIFDLYIPIKYCEKKSKENQ